MKAKARARSSPEPARTREAGAAPSRLKGEVVPPVKTLQLMHAIGPTRASKELGVSTTTLHKARKHNLVSRIIEIASEATLQRLGEELRSGVTSTAPAAASMAPSRGTVLFMLETTADRKSIVEQFAHMIGAKVLAT